MIVVDSSAVIAIFRQEEAGDYARRIAADEEPVMSAANRAATL